MRFFYIHCFIFIFTLFLTSCLNQEYDHRQHHHLDIEHHHHHRHDHAHEGHGHHHHHEPKNLDTIVKALENKERVIWQQPNKVIEMLGDIKGKTVADIGAGTGYFSFRMANEGAEVIPLEIDPRLIHYMDSIKKKLPEVVQERIHTRLATVDNPNLSHEETDAVILVNTYIYLQQRLAYLKKLAQGMKSGGKLLIVDYKKKKLPMGEVPSKKIRLSADSVEVELENAGYQIVKTDDTTLDYQYIILAMKP